MSGPTVALRAFSWDDLPLLVDLINRCEAVDQVGRGTSEEELRVWWSSPGVDPEHHAFLAFADGDVVGYGRILRPEPDDLTTS